jgi:Arc/MetJ-type ribon-helix-helix transcriptional regulator
VWSYRIRLRARSTKAVQASLFENATEVVRAAVREFITGRRFELIEKQQLQGITCKGRSGWEAEAAGSALRRSPVLCVRIGF